MTHAVSALRKAGVELAGDVWITGVIGHESPAGKKEGPKRLIQHLRSGKMHADSIIISEGPCAIWAASLGSTLFTVTVTTELGPIHTIKVLYSANPARWLGELLVEFERMERQFSEVAPHPLCGRERLNVVNEFIVPDDIYLANRIGPDNFHGQFEIARRRDDVALQILLTAGLKPQYIDETNLRISPFQAAREPFETPAAHPVVRALQEGGRVASGTLPEVIGMGLVGDANFYANDAGTPTVYYGPAHETAHSDHERVSISQLTHCAKVYATAAMTYCGVAE